MKKKQLEIYLQQVPDFPERNLGLEQYITPAEIAADMLYIAYQFNDIQDKKIIDLGCGTGIFSAGAALIGAKEIIGIDKDLNALNVAQEFASQNNLKINYIESDISKVNIKTDTVIMNPPFGAQKSNIHADRRFIEKAFEISKTIYTLHLTKTIPFIETMVQSLEGDIDFMKNYELRIKHGYKFHNKEQKFFNVTLLKINIKK